jgi:hypothetical protein
MLVGYMRVSSESDRQVTDLQRDALLAAGVDGRHLFEDHASGAKDDRPGLAQALAFVRPGDVLVVWKLDRGNSKAVFAGLDYPSYRGRFYQISNRYSYISLQLFEQSAVGTEPSL